MIHHHITTLGETFYETVDGREYNTIALKAITYTVGWFNIPKQQDIKSQGVTHRLDAGLWSFTELKKYLESNIYPLQIIEAVHWNGKIRMVSTADITFSDFLCDLFKFPRGPHTNVTSSGPIQDLSLLRNLNVHVAELSPSNNFMNGKLSTLLTTVGLEPYHYGDVRTVHFSNPVTKMLRTGPISGFNISIRDDKNNVVDNHGLPIELTLELKKIKH
jgi:hypothetical protein